MPTSPGCTRWVPGLRWWVLRALCCAARRILEAHTVGAAVCRACSAGAAGHAAQQQGVCPTALHTVAQTNALTTPGPLTLPLPLHPPTHRRLRLRLQSEIRVSVEGNVVRFGHQAHPDREQKDEKEEGIFHRSERVRWGAASTAEFSRFPQCHSRTHARTQTLTPAP